MTTTDDTRPRPAGPQALGDREIELMLSEPTPGVVEAVRHLDGDFVVLGASGKMGVTIASMIRRALDANGRKAAHVFGVARFRDAAVRQALADFGVEPVQSDLRDADSVKALPDAKNVLYLAGQKFGTEGAAEETWIQNTVVPSVIAPRFRDSRIAVFSTGCVYPLFPVDGPGAAEDAPPGFLGEYATTCIGRERVFTYYSKKFGTPMSILRLNYSVELRYGVLVDIAQKVFNGEAVDLSMKVVNVIWQRDACARAIQALRCASSPPKIINITGPEKLEVRELAERFGRALDRSPVFSGSPGSAAWHIDAGLSHRLFGPTTVGLGKMIQLVADHIKAGGRLLGKSTHFETRDGKF